MKDYWNIIKEQYSSDYIENSAKSKLQILEKVFDSMNVNLHTVAFLNYNPIIEIMSDDFDVYLESKEFHLVKNKKVQSFNLNDTSKKFPVVLGIDEHLTFFSNELDQKDQLEKIKNICSDIFLTTLCDYKNAAPFKKRQVEVLQEFKNTNVLLEHNVSNQFDKQAWDQYFYFIKEQKDFTVIGPYQRRTMYFKQLAKYSSDLGCREYVIQKQSLYRGFAKQHWEHIITVRF